MTDYIEREAVIAEIPREMDMQDLYLPVHFIELLNDVPAADVKPVVRGYNKNHDYSSLFKCSVCGWECRDTLSGDTTDYNFCPNCGADMREGEDE